MQSLIKYVLAGAALVGSSGACATVVNGAGGNGQMVLFVKNQYSGAVYARGLNLFVDDFVTRQQIVNDVYVGTTNAPDTSFSYTLPAPIGPDATLYHFLNTTDTFLDGTVTFQWTVIAPDTSPGAVAVGRKRYVVAQPSAPTATNTQLIANWVNVDGVYNILNGVLTGPDNSTGTDGQWDGPIGIGATLDTSFNTGGNNKNNLDTAANLYVATTSSTTGAQPARRYLLGAADPDGRRHS